MRVARYENEFEGIVWKVIPSADGKNLFLEVRQENLLAIQYYLLDTQKAELSPFWKPEEIDWWTSLVGGYGEKAATILMKDQKNPGPGILLIYDHKVEKLKKRVADFLLDSFDGLLISGTVFGSDGYIPFEYAFENDSIRARDISVPVLYRQGNEDFDTVSMFAKRFGHSIVLGVEYLELGDEIFFTYYVQSERTFDRYLCWLSNENLALHVRIDQKMSGIALESFITFQNKLIFVRDRSILSIYEINTTA